MQEPKPAGLRIAVVGGGCSGFSYSMAFENQPNMLDKTYNFGGFEGFRGPGQHAVPGRRRSGLRRDAGRLRFKFNNPTREIDLRLRQLL